MKKRSSKILIFLSLIFASLSANANTYGDEFCVDASYPDCGYCSNWVVDAEFLYWKARENGLGFAASGFAGLVEGNLEEVDWNWDPGFRVGIGYLFNCNEVSFTYTWYESDASGSFSGDLGISNWISSGQSFLDATANWHLRFNTFDLALKRHFCFCHQFFFAPYFALKGAYIRDNYDLTFPPTVDGSHSQKFYGIGPEIGFNSAWNFCNCWSFVAETGFSTLWTHYIVRRVDTSSTLIFNSNIRHTFDTLTFVPEYRLGIQWERGLCCNRYNLVVLAAWEQQLWIDHNQMITGPVDNATGRLILNTNTNLNLYGLTLRTQFVF